MSRKKKEEAAEADETGQAEPEARYSGDHPIKIPTEDKFNRWPFAKRIADTLREREDPSCIILGIYGAWGEGKTSALNLIEAELKESVKVAVVRFNPWYFSSEAMLIKGLFKTLAEAVGKKLESKGQEFGKALDNIGIFLSLASSSVGEAASKAAAKLSQAELSDDRDRIQKILRDTGVRVVVLIDDIDRLERQEIQALFKVVRLSADFEHVAYVLAFDRTVVAASLGERYGGGGTAQGAAFLEKIIQVPLHLPPAKKEALRRIAFDGTDAALRLAGIDITPEQGETIGIHFTQGLESRLSTPRQAYLFANALLFALPILKGEVNVVDQIIIEGLRIFYPILYEAIRDNPQLFLRSQSSMFGDTSAPERTKSLLAEAMAPLTDQQRADVQALLEYLFPRIGRSAYAGEWETTWAREQRICSPAYFDRYFAYGVGTSEISDVDFRSFLEALEKSTERQAGKLWVDFALPERMEAVIEKLRQRAGKMSGGLSERLAAALATSGEHLPTKEDFFFSVSSQAAMLISQLISSLTDMEARAALADRVLSTAKPLPLGAEIMRWLQPGSRPENRAVLKEEDLKRVGEKFAERIEEECRSEWPFPKYEGKTVGLLWTWKLYGSEDVVRTYVADGLRAKIGRLDNFLESFLGQTYSSGLPVKTDFSRRGYDHIASVVDPEIVNELVMQAYGNRIEPDRYHFDDETPDNLRIANQFAYLHRYVAEERVGAEPQSLSDAED